MVSSNHIYQVKLEKLWPYIWIVMWQTTFCTKNVFGIIIKQCTNIVNNRFYVSVAEKFAMLVSDKIIIYSVLAVFR
jgi:hypothetical protein